MFLSKDLDKLLRTVQYLFGMFSLILILATVLSLESREAWEAWFLSDSGQVVAYLVALTLFISGSVVWLWVPRYDIFNNLLYLTITMAGFFTTFIVLFHTYNSEYFVYRGIIDGLVEIFS